MINKFIRKVSNIHIYPEFNTDGVTLHYAINRPWVLCLGGYPIARSTIKMQKLFMEWNSEWTELKKINDSLEEFLGKSNASSQIYVSNELNGTSFSYQEASILMENIDFIFEALEKRVA